LEEQRSEATRLVGEAIIGWHDAKAIVIVQISNKGNQNETHIPNFEKQSKQQ